MTTNLKRNAIYEGHRASRPPQRLPSPCGTRISRMRSVMAIANTPSLNASTRLGFSCTPQRCVLEVDSAHTRQVGFMIRILKAGALMLIGIALAACGGDSNGPDARFACLGAALPTTASPTIVITGQVTDIVTHNPVSNASVAAFRTGDVTTPAAGNSSTPGSYNLLFRTGRTPVDAA